MKQIQMLPQAQPTEKNAESPTGTVHAVESVWEDNRIHLECGTRSSTWNADGVWGNRGWKLTDKPITCKTCLRVLGELKTYTLTHKEAAAICNMLEKFKHLASAFPDFHVVVQGVRKWDLGGRHIDDSH